MVECRIQNLAGVTGGQFTSVTIVPQPVERFLADLRQANLGDSSLAAAEMVEGHVDGDARQPVLERRAAGVELVERAPDLDEGFLCEVLQEGGVAPVAVEDGKDPRLVAPDQFTELVRGTAANLLQQLGVIVCHGRQTSGGPAPASIHHAVDVGDDGGIGKVVALLLPSVDLVELLRGQDRAHAGVKSGPYDREVPLGIAKTGGGGADLSLGFAGLLDGVAQPDPSLVDLER